MGFYYNLRDSYDPDARIYEGNFERDDFDKINPFTQVNFECTGNGVPGSQKGAVSTHFGHHWIIEDNEVRYANGVGIDIGHETPLRFSEHGSAGQIVRRNHISWAGACGITGTPGKGGNQEILIEHNLIEHTPWLNIEFNWESGAIKLHCVRNSLIRFNTIKDLPYGPGIWTDSVCENHRICGNVILGGKSLIFGGIFIEASDKINRIDHNVVYDIHANPLGTEDQRTSGGGHGIYEHDSDNIHIERNILLGMEGGGIFLNWGNPVRICNGHSPQGSGYRIIENIIAGCGRAYTFPTEKNFADGNILGANKTIAPIQIERNKRLYEMLDMGSARNFHNWELKGKCCEITYQVDPDKMTLAITFIVHEKRLSRIYDLTKPCDIQPVIDFLAAQDTSDYDYFKFFI
jgi:hypothetical protein